MKYINLNGILKGGLNPILTQLFAAIGINTILSVSDITSFSGNDFDTLYVSDINRGGQFIKYTGDSEADGGMIFLDSQGNKWLRVVQDGVINIRWYGARANSLVDFFDSFLAFQGAIAFIENNIEFDTLFIPADSSGYGSYYLSDTLNISSGIKILGEGTMGFPTSELHWPPHTQGMILSYDYGEPAFAVDLRNIALTCDTDGTFNGEKHAITASCQFHIDNVVVDQFDGDGLHISACLLPTTGENDNYGNASLSILRNFTATYCRNGIFIEGCDANSILVENSSTSQCRRWGIYDNGFLGNTHIKPHTAFNGVGVAGNNTVVTYGGKYYAALPGHDDYYGDGAANLNKQPDLNLGTYWQEVNPMTGTGAWSAVRTYVSGGAIAIANVNAWSKIIDSYSEEGQPPIYLNGRSKVDGGDNGAGVVGGLYRRMLFGIDHFLNANQMFPNHPTAPHLVGIGTSEVDASTILSIFNDYSKSSTVIGQKSEGSTDVIYNQLKNTTTTALYGLNATNVEQHIGATLVSILNTIGFDIIGTTLRIRTAKTPASAGAAGNAGEICWDANFIYVCVANASWKRIGISAW